MGFSSFASGRQGDLSGRRSPVSAAGWPIKLWLSTVVVLAMVVLSMVVVSMGWRGARESLVETASKTARDAGLLVAEKSRRMSEPAEATLRILATDPIANAKSLDERLERLRTLADVLISNPLAEAIFVGYTDGSFLLVRSLDKQETRLQLLAPPRSNFLVQSIESQSSSQVKGSYLFYDANLNLLERRAQPNYKFDPRTRPWFEASTQTEASLLSAPYIFFTTRHVGITLSQISENSKAVFGIDVVLEDLGNTLSDFRTSPHAQLALVNKQDKVLAYFDMKKVLVEGSKGIEFVSLEQLKVPSLVELTMAAPDVGKVIPYQVDGQHWFGVVLPFDVWSSGEIRLLVAFPSDDLLGDLTRKLKNLILVIALLIALLLPAGWWAGASIARSFRKLSTQAQRMSRFDFKQSSPQQSVVQEANSLASVMNEMGQMIQAFLQISQIMASEPKVEDMLDTVLQQMVTATRCQAGAVYLLTPDGLRMERASENGILARHQEHEFAYDTGAHRAAGLCDISPGLMEMQLELRGRKGDLEGLLMLQYPNDEGHRDPSFSEFVHKLSGMLAVSIETRQLIDAQKDLLDAVIRVLADAIDAKSPYTGEHCERVPALAGMIIDGLRAETQGPYAEFSMTDDERYEFHLGAWLHDCGKVTSPEHIIDKATKLEAIYNRIHEVRMRFEVLWRDAELMHWRAVASGGDGAELRGQLQKQQQSLRDDFEFVARCNVGGEFMADADIERLRELGQMTWQRHFDKLLGLSTEETVRINTMAPETLPVTEFLLADRPDHKVPWGGRKPAVDKSDARNLHGFDMVSPEYAQNLGEIYNLSVRKGTLTEEDRFKINDHMVQTLVMLRALPWPKHLAKVPDIASTHHERLDGNGYPRRLNAAQLTIADRVMALADIFEALTAADRPYKPPKTLSESMQIMARMARDQHIDAQLFRYFLRSNLWRQFAEKFVQPSQMDAVNLDEIERVFHDPAI